MRKADLTVDVVAGLLASQLPQWSGLEVRPVELDGWDNTTFRLGDDLDPGTWARARGWALWKALIALPLDPDHPARTGAQAGWHRDAAGVVEQLLAEVR